jgi:hypothetical protein
MLTRAALALTLTLVFQAAAAAQEHATLILKSGERVAGDLVDLGGSGFTVSVDGKNREIPTGDVALISFTGASRRAAPAGGEHVLVLRSGKALRGKLVDIGGTKPLKITFNTNGKDQEFSSAEIASIVLASPPRAR